MNLAELLSKADLPGELEFKDDKGNVFKLSDLRAMSSGIEEQKTKYTKEQQRAEQIAKEAEDLLNGLKTTMAEVEKSRTKAPDEKKTSDWRKNPLYEEIVPVVEALEQQAKEAREVANTVKKSLDQSQAIYAAERLRRQWAEAKIKPKDVKFEDAVKHVLENKIVDGMGLPTLETYLYQATEPDRIQTAIKEAIDKNNKDWEQKMRMAAGSGKPGSGTKFSTKKAGEPPIKDLKDLTSELVASDPDVAKAMEGGDLIQ